jgi:hypothetical protein
MGRWREECVNMGSAPPFDLMFTAIPVDLRIENSDNVPKGFYGAAPARKKGLGWRGRRALTLKFRDLRALKAIDGSAETRPLVGAMMRVDATIYVVSLALVAITFVLRSLLAPR